MALRYTCLLVLTFGLVASGAFAQGVKGNAPAAAPVAGPPDAAGPVVAGEASELRVGDGEYDLRIRELEGKVHDLKERIFRSKAKLTLLTQAVTDGSLGQGASAVIVHRNEMSGSFILTGVAYFLDGAPLWQETDETGARFGGKNVQVVWDGNIVEGSHTLSVQLSFRGNGKGLFSYLDGYKFELKDSFTFTVEAGKRLTLDVVGFEQGNFTTELTERPTVRFDSKIEASNAIPTRPTTAE